MALAEELGSFSDFVGGPQYAHILLTPLETLCAVEETVVREKAVESTGKIAAILTQKQLEDFYIPMLKRLASGDWFTSRTSACGIFAPCYSTCSPAVQDELRRLYGLLVNDETPMVRRASGTHLAKLAKKVTKQHLITEIIPLFNKLAEDEQDSVRVLVVESLIAITESLTHEESKNLILNNLRNLSADKSWRVRYMVSEKFVQIAKAVGNDIIKDEMIGSFVHMLKDNEAEVRTAAASQVPGFGVLIEPETVLREIMPCVKDLVSDSSQHVRAALATHVSGLAPILGKENTIEHLLPLFLQLLKDEASEVRLNIISKLDRVNQVIGIELLSQSLLPAIVELAEDKQWRVRLAIIENIPLLASQLGVAFFDEKLGNLCMSWLGDCVFSIREAATVNLRKLTEVFGVEWAKVAIIPKIMVNAQHSNYLYRMTTIFAITTLSEVLPPPELQSAIIPMLTNLSSDTIPNIRFNVAKSFTSLVPILRKHGLDAVIETSVKPSLKKLSEDADGDVKFYGLKGIRGSFEIVNKELNENRSLYYFQAPPQQVCMATPENTIRLHVSGIPYAVSDVELSMYLSSTMGAVKELYLPKSTEFPFRNKGYAFTTFTTLQATIKALNSTHVLRGRRLRFQLENKSRSTAKTQFTSLFREKVKDSYPILELSVGNWVGAEEKSSGGGSTLSSSSMYGNSDSPRKSRGGNAQAQTTDHNVYWKFLKHSTVTSVESMYLKFESNIDTNFASKFRSLNIFVSPPPQGKTSTRQCMIQITLKNLFFGFDGKLARVLDYDDSTYINGERTVKLYLTLDLGYSIFRPSNDIGHQPQDPADSIFAQYLTMQNLDDRECRTVDFTAGNSTNVMEDGVLGLSKCNVFCLTIIRSGLERLKSDLNEMFTGKNSFPAIHLAMVNTIGAGFAMESIIAWVDENVISWISKRSFRVCYYLQVLISHRVVLLQELVENLPIVEKIKDLVEDGEEELLVKVFLDLFVKRALKWNPTKPTHKRPIHFLSEFIKREEKYQRKLSKRGGTRPEMRMSLPTGNQYIPPDFSFIYSLTVTPTSTYLEFPIYEQGNRILRKFKQYEDRFLRVNFADEDGEKLGSRFDGYLTDIIEKRVLKIMKEGLTVAGRKYEFLAFSTSQLRDHGMWFFSNTSDLTASNIRNWMGDFSGIKIAAKYAARMGQCFTTTYQTIDIPTSAVREIPDIETYDPYSKKKYTFTDGVGKISSSLMKKAVLKYRGYNSQNDEIPSACQIRFGGCKGMVTIDNTLKDDQIHIRPSMKKFDGNSTSLEIVKTSRACRQSYMNRQLIMVLSHLGIPSSTFLSYQDKFIQIINEIPESLSSAKQAFSTGLAGGSHFVGVGMEVMARKGVNRRGLEVMNEPFFNAVLELTRIHCLMEVKERARFPVDDSFLLFGVIDETNTLEEGQVFVQISEILRDNNGQIQQTSGGTVLRRYQVLTGEAIVGRNPVMHPGDVQKVQAVKCEKLMHIKNCIVFSQRGLRPLPNKLSGGDLDGDEFFISLNKHIIPPKFAYPMEFDSQTPKTKSTPITMHDIADFVGDYIINDRLGIISNLHLACADYYPEGPAHPDCLTLAHLASVAVDFPKTGVPAELSKGIKLDKYPQFLHHRSKPSYKSERALGKLYDAVEMPSTSNNQLLKYKTSKSHRVQANLNLLYPGWEDYLDDAIYHFSQYAYEVWDIMQRYHIDSEVECLTGMILTLVKARGTGEGFAVSRVQGKKKFDVACAVRQAMAAVVARFRSEFYCKDGGKKNGNTQMVDGVHDGYVGELSTEDVDLDNEENWKMASAWYFVAYADEMQRDKHYDAWEAAESEYEVFYDDEYPMLSFGWVAGDVFAHAIEKLK